MLSRFAIYFCLSVIAPALPIFDVQAIGPAGYRSGATAINALGHVVGNYELPDGSRRGFVYQNGVTTSLVNPTGASDSYAYAISNTAIGGGALDGSASPSGILWAGLSGPTTLVDGFVMGLQEGGHVAGLMIASDGMGHAFVIRGGEFVQLQVGADTFWSVANAINPSGVAGGSMLSGSTFQAFRAEGNAATPLTGLGGGNSYGTAINDAGLVAGHAQLLNGAMRATVWGNGPGPVNLGTLGGTNSYAYGIDAQGRVVGYSNLLGGDDAAYLYQDGLMYDLNGLLAGGATGWRLTAAYGINSSGQIVGTGFYNGVEQAFLLTPQMEQPALMAVQPVAVPEPSPFWLTLPTLAALLLLRRR